MRQSNFALTSLKKARYLGRGALLLGAGVMAMGLSAGFTTAYYQDTEASAGNSFQAGRLDLELSRDSYRSLIGPEVGGERRPVTVARPSSESIPIQYSMRATSTGVGPGFCKELEVEAEHNGREVFRGSLAELKASSTEDFGSWEFQVDLPPATEAAHGEICRLGVEYFAWSASAKDPRESGQGGWSDTEVFDLDFTARTVVLNEIYPAPPADATEPPYDDEFIELYNTGSEPVDLAGWRLSELSGGDEKSYTVVAGDAGSEELQPVFGTSTTIAPGQQLALKFGSGSQLLNNGGDTVTLYDDTGRELDQHQYPDTAHGKSHARFLDGIGAWVDPEPTPNAPNRVTYADLEASGFSAAEIREMEELARSLDRPLPRKETSEDTADRSKSPEQPASSRPAEPSGPATTSSATSSATSSREASERAGSSTASSTLDDGSSLESGLESGNSSSSASSTLTANPSSETAASTSSTSRTPLDGSEPKPDSGPVRKPEEEEEDKEIKTEPQEPEPEPEPEKKAKKASDGESSKGSLKETPEESAEAPAEKEKTAKPATEPKPDTPARTKDEEAETEETSANDESPAEDSQPDRAETESTEEETEKKPAAEDNPKES